MGRGRGDTDLKVWQTICRAAPPKLANAPTWQPIQSSIEKHDGGARAALEKPDDENEEQFGGFACAEVDGEVGVDSVFLAPVAVRAGEHDVQAVLRGGQKLVEDLAPRCIVGAVAQMALVDDNEVEDAGREPAVEPLTLLRPCDGLVEAKMHLVGGIYPTPAVEDLAQAPSTTSAKVEITAADSRNVSAVFRRFHQRAQAALSLA